MYLELKRDLFLDTILAVLVLLFVYTGVDKLAHLIEFRLILEKLPILNLSPRLNAYLIPVVELVIVALLFLPKFRIYGLWAFFCLMLAFALYVGYIVLFVPHLPCSCGGIIKEMTWRQHIVFNLGFTLLALWGIILERKKVK